MRGLEGSQSGEGTRVAPPSKSVRTLRAWRDFMYRHCLKSRPALLLPATAILVAVAACGDGETTPSDDVERTTNSYSSQPERVQSERFYSAPELGSPTRLALADDKLVALNSYGEPYVHVIDRTDGALITSFGRSGEGPGEYVAPFTVSTGAARDMIYVGDAGIGRITSVDLTAITDDSEPYSRIIPVAGMTFQEIIRVPDGFLANSRTGRDRFIRIDMNGGIVTTFGPPPPVDTTEVPPEIAAFAYADVIAVNHQRGLIAAGGVWTGSLVIYESDGSIRDSVDTPIRFQPRYSVGRRADRPSFVPSQETRQGYVDLAGSSCCIFGLFSGKSLAESSESSATAGRDVHVFTWSGDLVRVLRVDRNINSLVFDPDDDSFFASHWGVDPSIIRFSIPGGLDDRNFTSSRSRR